ASSAQDELPFAEAPPTCSRGELAKAGLLRDLLALSARGLSDAPSNGRAQRTAARCVDSKREGLVAVSLRVDARTASRLRRRCRRGRFCPRQPVAFARGSALE
ncbi:unnamed protein product, partial [Polarella glacialis]